MGTTIELAPDVSQQVEALAAREGVSIDEVIRRSVFAYAVKVGMPDRAELLRRAREIPGKYSSGLGDLAENHDKYLTDPDDE